MDRATVTCVMFRTRECRVSVQSSTLYFSWHFIVVETIYAHQSEAKFMPTNQKPRFCLCLWNPVKIASQGNPSIHFNKENMTLLWQLSFFPCFDWDPRDIDLTRIQRQRHKLGFKLVGIFIAYQNDMPTKICTEPRTAWFRVFSVSAMSLLALQSLLSRSAEVFW